MFFCAEKWVWCHVGAEAVYFDFGNRASICLAKLYFNSNSGMLVDGVDFSRRLFWLYRDCEVKINISDQFDKKCLSMV
ncbi:hypothetical protein AWH49_06875 [Domibacillus aminovorans]|uniref:Uncharacterized protein n=1 Tax=Domibacillus aminovorans TaxID=29332 RepID=A0A177LBS1_9BACI|nr:hypothetical protein AWH49_06875 [Domibacillus aminovorans]